MIVTSEVEGKEPRRREGENNNGPRDRTIKTALYDLRISLARGGQIWEYLVQIRSAGARVMTAAPWSSQGAREWLS
jgi:hypothetical protein